MKEWEEKKKKDRERKWEREGPLRVFFWLTGVGSKQLTKNRYLIGRQQKKIWDKFQSEE